MSSNNSVQPLPQTPATPQASGQGDPVGVQTYAPDARYELRPNVLLALAPGNPLTQFIQQSEVTQVSIDWIKEGSYCNRRAFFVCLEICVQSSRVNVLKLDVFFNTPLANSTNGAQTGATASQPNARSSALHKLKAAASSGFKSARSKATSLYSSVTRRGAPRQRFDGPYISVAGPELVGIPVANKDTIGMGLEPDIQAAGGGGKLFSQEKSNEQTYQIEHAPWIRVAADGNYATIRAEKASGDARLPPLFRVGFVVCSNSDIEIEVRRSKDESACGHLHSQVSFKQVLKDTTGNGAHPSTFTCLSTLHCQNGGSRLCKEFYDNHMTEASWKQKLARSLPDWDGEWHCTYEV